MFFISEMFDLKMKFDESDNVLVRGTRFFTDKISSVFGKFCVCIMYQHLVLS